MYTLVVSVKRVQAAENVMSEHIQQISVNSDYS